MNIFTKMYKSLYDFKSYVLFKREGMGKAFLYLLLVSLIIGVLGMIRPIYEVKLVTKQFEENFKEKIQDIGFKNGNLHVKSEEKLEIDEDGVYVNIDTNKEMDKSLLTGKRTGLLVSKDKLYYKNGAEGREISFNELHMEDFGKDDVLSFFRLMMGFSYVAMCLLPLWIFIKNMFSALIVALFAMIICAIQKTNEKYGTLYKLSIYALTLSNLVYLLTTSSGLVVPHFYKLYCLIGIIYMWFVIKAINNSDSVEIEA